MNQEKFRTYNPLSGVDELLFSLLGCLDFSKGNPVFTTEARNIVASYTRPAPSVGDDVVEAMARATRDPSLWDGCNQATAIKDIQAALTAAEAMGYTLAPSERVLPLEAIEQLTNHQRQLDMDGVEVGVSRQALDEVLAAIGKVQK